MSAGADYGLGGDFNSTICVTHFYHLILHVCLQFRRLPGEGLAVTISMRSLTLRVGFSPTLTYELMCC